MAINPPNLPIPQPDSPVIQWLLDGDPAIRWQVLRDLAGAGAAEIAAERTRVATEGAEVVCRPRLNQIQAVIRTPALYPST